MEQQRTCVLYCCVLVLALLFSHPLSGTAQEVEDEREFDYIEGSEKGPGILGRHQERMGRLQNRKFAISH
ncbi:hypothetical protein OIU77_030392 [Salix suchowensis]|uniref:Uncharacterized protein n=1 Tax=Salix suchowensis TaxID=1278906 RepID=A0ABQ9BBR9_9ROSI|nr:hypothetical protein OIU77_030392 [Salix suchowensis]